MSERLTQRTTEPGPRWVTWIPYIVIAISGGVLGARVPAWDIPEPSDSLYAIISYSLQTRLSPRMAPFTHVMLALLLLWGSGILVRSLLPPKAPRATKALAQSLGMVTPLIALTPWLRDQLAPNALLPALTALVWAQITLLQSLSPGKHPLTALVGLLSGLASGLSLFIGLGSVPLGLWLLIDLLRKTDSALRRAGFFLAGALVSLLPFTRELSSRIQNIPFTTENWSQTFSPLYTGFGIGGLLIIFLALLVGALQKNRILLTFLLSTSLFLKAGHIALASPTLGQTGAILLFPCLLYAYGIFRLLKGIESGVHAINPAKTKHITLLLLILLLLATKLWAAWFLHQP